MKGKVVIITGGSSGIGKALAEKFGQAGSKILITGRNEARLKDTVNLLRLNGIEANSFMGDVSIEENNKRMVAEAIRIFGRIDILINNAGVGMRALFEDSDLEVFKNVININFYGTVYATKYCLPHILESKGSIIGVSSIIGRRGTPARTAYSASKFAMEGFLEALRMEVMKRGVHVLTACPGFTTSNIRQNAYTANGHEQGESPRNEENMMSAEVVANSIYQATLKQKRDIVLTVKGKLVVFLNKWLPRVMDNIVHNAMAKEADSPLKN